MTAAVLVPAAVRPCGRVSASRRHNVGAAHHAPKPFVCASARSRLPIAQQEGERPLLSISAMLGVKEPAGDLIQVGRERIVRPQPQIGTGGGSNGGGNGKPGSGGGGGGGSGNDGGGGNGGDGSSSGGSEGQGCVEVTPGLAALLTSLGRKLNTFPRDLAEAAVEGRVPIGMLNRFAELEKSWVNRLLLRFAGFRERLLLDNLFLTKVGIEVFIGTACKILAEYEKRRSRFWAEIDYVAADLVMALIADFCLVWLPAPTLALRASKASGTVATSAVARFFALCPENAFQTVLPGMRGFSIAQRCGAIVRNGGKLLCVGTFASFFGTGATNALSAGRKMLMSPAERNAAARDTTDDTHSLPLIESSLVYGVYLSLSSNLRYQVMAGILEQRILEPMLHRAPLLLSSACFALRSANTFLGSLLWVDFARLTGIQGGKKAAH